MEKQFDVRNVSGLQDILQNGVDNHFTTSEQKRDHDWTRLTVMCVNSGNGLLRTQMRMDEIRERLEREVRKTRNKRNKKS